MEIGTEQPAIEITPLTQPVTTPEPAPATPVETPVEVPERELIPA